MPSAQAFPSRILAAIALVFLPLCTIAQSSSQLPTIAPNLLRTEGVDTASGIAYTRLYVSAADSPSFTAQPATLDLSNPTLTAQCTKRANGKLFFELFVNFGGVTDTAFYHPWTPADGGLFPPRTTKITMTMEFLGYTKVKPMKRQWELVLQPAGQYRYNQPGSGSSNLDDFPYFFQYLRALPTLRLTVQNHSASFLTTALMAQLHKEPLCAAAGL